MRMVSIEQIIGDEKNVILRPTDSYLFSYPEFVSYFANLETITRHSLIIGAHFTYGWMPRILSLRFDTKEPEEAFAIAVAMLNEAKRGVLISEKQLRFLKHLVNNSVVGPSKLLHFINPHLYAIWDSRVCGYLSARSSHRYKVDEVADYFAYLDNCEEITRDKRFEQVHRSMNGKIGYAVTAYRALELVMYASITG